MWRARGKSRTREDQNHISFFTSPNDHFVIDIFVNLFSILTAIVSEF